MLLYHGTSFESYEQIKREGFKPETPTWNVSEDDKTYFYTIDKMMSSECLDDEEEAQQMAITRAFESAQITAALQKSLANKIVVIEIEIDENKVDVCDDDSCQNMADIASYIYNSDLTTSNIKHIFIADYSPFFALYHAASIYGNEVGYPNFDLFTQAEINIIEAIKGTEIFIDDLLYFEWEELTEV
jgi:hypothetical protein